MKKRILAIGLIPSNVLLAACLRSQWDTIKVVSRALIGGELEYWRDRPEAGELTIVLDGVSDPKRVRAALDSLLKSGVKITWICRKTTREIENTVHGLRDLKLCGGLSPAEFLEGEGLFDANVKKAFEVMEVPGAVLPDYIRYKANLLLMGDLCLKPLEEAIDQVWKMIASGEVDRLHEEDDNVALRQFRDSEFPYLEGRTKPIRDLKARIPKVGASDMSVLILGNTGTGKDGIAFYLHDYSKRRGRPFVAVNCAALEPELLRSELFGHERGSFPGAIRKKTGLCEMADGGTLFLDEIGDMTLPVQSALLQFLETRRFRTVGGTTEKTADIRVIAAAQRDLLDKIARGQFRRDLYYRLAQVEMETPDLKDVRQDIPQIMKHLVSRSFRGQEDYSLIRRHLTALEKDYKNQVSTLETYSWPGNVRELAALARRRIELDEDGFAELAKRIKSGESLQMEQASSELFSCIRPGLILPLKLVKIEYAKTILKCNPEMPRVTVAKRLGISCNALKKLDV